MTSLPPEPQEGREGFLGKEDPHLTDTLKGELTGILNWALEGLRRARPDDGKFSAPASPAEVIRACAARGRRPSESGTVRTGIRPQRWPRSAPRGTCLDRGHRGTPGLGAPRSGRLEAADIPDVPARVVPPEHG